jgi:hypothetical protein
MEEATQTTPQALHFTAVNKMVSTYCRKRENMAESNGGPVTILILENC